MYTVLQQKEPIIINYVPFGEKAITMMVNLYQQTAKVKAVVKGNILTLILEVSTRLDSKKSFLLLSICLSHQNPGGKNSSP